ncbi:SLC13 family permease [Paludibacterium purpuratum]|uniref:YbiR family transporter n=1 Tax=Paludibacterium purpuratum TaxID=1144873 RepID=A0A4R7AYW0_9NEIS|nr:anion transporter [Paludibacterium purpuratum]TDR73270.1 YbiR family transporter [Paludibacterium purpuratum]
MPHNPTDVAAILIFLFTYLVVAIGRLPKLQLDRAGAAVLGASLMVAFGVMSLAEAWRAIDFETLLLLLGMMILVANLRLSGFFALVNRWAVERARHPLALLIAVTLVSGVLSAFLVNDMVCLVLTPLVLDMVLLLGRNPVPYLLAVAMGSNIGSVATLTGNPQNIIVGSLSHIPYPLFFARLAPVALMGLALCVLVIGLAFRREFASGGFAPVEAQPVRFHGVLVVKSLLATLVLVVSLFAGAPAAGVAMLIGSLLLLTRRVKAHKVYREVDGPLLMLFGGLFVVVAGLEKTVMSPALLAQAGHWPLGHVPLLSIVTAVLSNIVSNVPAVLVLKPFIEPLANAQQAWLTVAMASTLAGNFTLVGSVANLIVAHRARARGVDIGFWRYFLVGAPLTVLTILCGAWWLS